jgi:hypothetical protein
MRIANPCSTRYAASSIDRTKVEFSTLFFWPLILLSTNSNPRSPSIGSSTTPGRGRTRTIFTVTKFLHLGATDHNPASHDGFRFAQPILRAVILLGIAIENYSKLLPWETLKAALSSRALPSKCTLPNLDRTQESLATAHPQTDRSTSFCYVPSLHGDIDRITGLHPPDFLCHYSSPAHVRGLA